MTNRADVLSEALPARDRALLALHLSGLTTSEIARLQLRDVRLGDRGGVLVHLRSATCDTCGRFIKLAAAQAIAVSRYRDEAAAVDGARGVDPLFRSAGRRGISERGVRWVLRSMRMGGVGR